MTERSLYVIADGNDAVKIGVGAHPKRRLQQLQTGNARRLALRRSVPFDGTDADQVERYAHWLLREHHIGGEWFSVDEKVALATLLAAGAAVIKGLRVPRPGFGGKGRPPKQRGRLVVSKTVWIYPDAMARVLAFKGPGEVAQFVRDAIDEKLDREGAPSFDPVTMPLKQPRAPKRAKP